MAAATGRRIHAMNAGLWTPVDSRLAATQFAEVAVPGTGFKNLIINGDFQIVQRGATFTTPTNGFPLWDQWYAGSAATTSTGTSTWNRRRMFEDFSVPDASGISHNRYIVTVQQTVGMTAGIIQRFSCWIEDVRRFADCNMTLSFSATADSTRNLNARALVYYGSGGSPSSTVAPTGGLVGHSITTTATRFNQTITFPSLSGKTIGTNGDDGLVIQFEMPVTGTFTYNFWDFQLEYGSTATAFERLPVSEQLRRCQRYYCKTFNQGVTPAQNTADYQGALTTVLTETAIAQATVRWPFPVTMRVPPSITTYNPGAANNDFRDLTDGTNIDATVEAVGDAGASIRTGLVFGHSNNKLLYIHADAEAGIRV